MRERWRAHHWKRLGRRSVLWGCLGGGALVAWLHLRAESLPGVRVAGEPVRPTIDVMRELERRQQQYLAAPITLQAGSVTTSVARQALGATRDVTAVAARIAGLGRGPNPLVNVMDLVRAYGDGWDLAWPVSVDRTAAADVIRSLAHQVEKPPLVGTVGDGWSMEGVPGIALNSFDALAQVEKALQQGEQRILFALRQVSPPEPLPLGAPDGAFEGGEDVQQLADAAYRDPEALAAFQPQTWAQSRGPECDLSGTYARFCQGPRRVAAPFGDDAQRADALGLGTFQAVSTLIAYAPSDAWIEAAGGPSVDATLLHPVKGGTLWRGYGFVRAGDLRDVLHKGVDIGAPRGTPMRAVNDGIVAYADNGVRGYGNLLVLIHGSGAVTSYAHCNAIYVFAGQRVARGQIVGEVGDTGIARGVHLHFEYRRGGQPVDPQERFVDQDL